MSSHWNLLRFGSINSGLKSRRTRLKLGCLNGLTKRWASSRMTNRLRDEMSPYLLQHQHNPVDWHSWNPTTLELAKSSGKPIFLSSGYSTCHWCHVMERESFENTAVADIMNQYFINIKLDREEHPDIDRVYMTFVQAISGSGGWPMSVWMTPELEPFYGGTYYPPDNQYGRPGFKSLLLSLAEQWGENRDTCIESSKKIMDALRKSSTLPISTALPSDPGKKCLAQLARAYEPAYGGFSEQPKFPQPVNIQFLIQYSKKEPDCFKMVDKTLREMRKGGIYDHLGLGFCRYSTDKKWHVPHFEKMLYDQSQLVSAYLNAFLVTKDNFFADVAREVLNYVSRDMSVEEGGFYSAEDADSLPTKDSTGPIEKKEGAFYVWEKAEIEGILSELKPLSNGTTAIDLFCTRYGVTTNGNVNPHQDPHGELKNKNILFEAKTIDTISKDSNLEADEIKSKLDTAKEMLFNWRNANRPRPHLDNKFIASWNGLMISAFAQAGFVLADDTFTNRAIKGAEFLQNNFYAKGKFLRTCYVTKESGLVTNLKSPIAGCVDDFCNVIGAMIDLFQATGNPKYLRTAFEMQDKQDHLFWDSQNGGYFISVSDPSIILRMKDDDDGAEPSSNSTSLNNLLRLNAIAPSDNYSNKVSKLLLQFSDRIGKIPITLPLMTSGLNSFQHGVKAIFIIGKNARNHELYHHVRRQLLPAGSIVVTVDSSQDFQELKTLLPTLNEKLANPPEEVTAFVRHGTVETVVKKAEDLSLF